jgi:predicted amidohydrolase
MSTTQDIAEVLTLSMIQFDIIWNDVEGNLTKVRSLVEAAVKGGADFIILPEMFLTGFSFPKGELARQAEEAGRDFLLRVAEDSDIFIGGSLPTDPTASYSKPYNTFCLYSRRGIEAEYSKLHLFSFSDEVQQYSAGNSTVTTWIKGWRVTPFICYDLRFSQPFAERANDTDLYVVVANWPQTRREHWKTLITARAIENQAFVAGVNRIGSGGGLHYSGNSLLVSPLGECLSYSEGVESILTCRLSRSEVTSWRRNFSCIVDRRHDYTHTDLLQREKP